MKLFFLTHFDGRDYYVHTITNLGLFTTREKAAEAKARAEKYLEGDWLATSGRDCESLYFEIEEVETDKDWFSAVEWGER